MPAPFEGFKLVVNKGLSNHFQISHSLNLSATTPSSYHFGATYVGSKQVSPTEVNVPWFFLCDSISLVLWPTVLLFIGVEQINWV